jgi:hypothetical protein
LCRLDSAEIWLNVTDALVRCARNRRLSLITDNLRRLVSERSSTEPDTYLAYLMIYILAGT